MNGSKLPPIALVREAFEQAMDANVHQGFHNDPSTVAQSRNPSIDDPPTTNSVTSDTSTRGIESLKTLLLAGSRLLVSEAQVDRARAIIIQLADLPDTVEPFERIREAIQEAQSQIARTANSRTAAA